MRYKDYKILEFTDLVPTGSNVSKLLKIRNLKTGNTFHYIVKISSTLQDIKKIKTEDNFISESLEYIKEKLDEHIEDNDFEINITTSTKKKDLGIFYTDPMVVDFIFDILNIWKQKEDREKKRWELHNSPHYPSVIDPAVGEGLFLKTAIEKGFTQPKFIFGLDLDKEVVEKWSQINLLKSFENKKDVLEAHFFHQNGLDKIHWDQHDKKKYYSHLKNYDLEKQQFDAVVGNPPYGGIGVQPDHLDSESMLEQLAGFKTLHKNEAVKKDLQKASGLDGQIMLLENIEKPKLSKETVKKLGSFPIEVLFIERFIQLAKPCGWIALILPDGIFSNASLDYVRKYIASKAKVEAIVSLPRDAFKSVGTNAKTSILFLKKYKESDKIDNNYTVFLASVNKMSKEAFNILVDNYERYYK